MNRRAVRLLQLSFAFAVLAVSSDAQAYPLCSGYNTCAYERSLCPKPLGTHTPSGYCDDGNGNPVTLYSFTCPLINRSGYCY